MSSQPPLPPGLDDGDDVDPAELAALMGGVADEVAAKEAAVEKPKE